MSSLIRLQKQLQNQSVKKEVQSVIPQCSNYTEGYFHTETNQDLNGILLPYQLRWINDQSSIKIAVKSRRIGFSWCDACDSVLAAGRQDDPADTFYIGYNKEMALSYIQDCAEWAKLFGIAAESVQESFVESEKDIIAYRITFATGKIIQALSSRPRNIRSKGKPGARLRIDEFAFHDSPQELLKAAIAFKMWGGKIAIWSTHNGKKSEFNQLINQIKAGDKPFSYHEVTLKQAVYEGLYKRICLVSGEEWSNQKEEEWIKELYQEYGISAQEELDCQPADYNEIKFIDRVWFSPVPRIELPVCDRVVRFWDLAATQADMNNKKKQPCNTAGVKLGYSTTHDVYVVLDVIAEAFNPTNTDQLIKDTALLDGKTIPIAHEQEGGASGIRDAQHIREMLESQDFSVSSIRPEGDKLLRGRGFATTAKQGRILIPIAPWNEDYLDELDSIPLGLMDRYDASVGAFNYLSGIDPIQELQGYLMEWED
jgi:predicted phage terminase large subunit-like protein